MKMSFKLTEKSRSVVAKCLIVVLLLQTTPFSSLNASTKDAKRIKIALLLDTSNSMDGLINQAKSQLWTLVNELANAKCGNDSRPIIEIALYEYGNDRLSAMNGYIKMVTPLTNDLDKLSADLFSLSTNGGSEFCGHAIQTSLNQLTWNADGNDLQIIFIAGNEPFNQGIVDYRGVCANAKKKNIIVNTIFCGEFNEGVRTFWKEGADLTNGTYMSIEQDRKTEYISTPYDQKISILNDSINSTYIYYGTQGVSKKQNQLTQDNNAGSLGEQNKVNRSISKSKQIYKNESWDLVDASESKDFDVKKIEKKTLPSAMQNLNDDEIKKEIVIKNKKRENYKTQINELSTKRDEYIKSQKKTNGNAPVLEDAMLKAVKEQAKSKSIKFEQK